MEQITRVGGIYLLSISVFIMGADARIAAWGMVLGEAVSTIYTILAYFRRLFFENSIFFQKNLQKNNSNKNKQNKKISNTKNQNERISNKNNSDKILKNYNKKYADKRTFSRQADSFTLSTRELLEHFFSFSIPISMNHFCLTIISSLETMLIPFMLEIFFHSHSQALETYGTLTGMALPFLFFPATIVNSLSVMLMPAISSAYDQKQHRQMENTISASLHFCLLIGIFSTFAFLIYGTVLGETIFHSKEAGQYVYLFSVLCPFMYAAQTTSSILNGFGKTKQTLYHNLLGVGIRIFFILLLTGIYFSAYQLAAAYPKFEYTLSALTFVFLISVPILTMRVLAEERKQKTDQLLLTSPVSVGQIVLGKYLALVTIFAIPMVIMCFYPLLMSKFGTVSFAGAYTGILGFFLLGCANLAIGVFVSSLTESQVIAAVLTFVFLFAFYMMNGISSFFSEGALSTCITFGLLILAAALIIYTMIKNLLISAAVCVIGEIILAIIYVVNSSFFSGGIQKVLNIVNLSSHFDNFANSIFDIKGILYFVSVIAVCLFLTVQSIAKRRWN